MPTKKSGTKTTTATPKKTIKPKSPAAKVTSKKSTESKSKPAKAAVKPGKVAIGKQGKVAIGKPGKVAAGKSAKAAAKPSSSEKKSGPNNDGVFVKASPENAQEIMNLLCRQYPDAECELTFRNDFELLISVILSAQTTDANVNRVTPKLFARFPDAKSLAEAPLDEVKELVRSTGYFNAKAQNIQNCAQGLVTRFGGKVPETVEELTTLPGVGRKTANVVLGVVHNIPGWTVDTHVQRLSKRLGFSQQEDPLKIEKDLQLLFPEKDWTKYSITLIWHGRRCCEARNPQCQACPVNHLCPSSRV